MSGGPPPPPPPPAAKPKKLVTVPVQLARTPAGKALGENFVFFDYPAGLGMKRDRSGVRTLEVEAKTINLSTPNEQRSLINAIKLAGFGRDFADFSLSWGRHFAEHYETLRETLRPWHKLNHLPSSHLLSHKNFLAHAMAHLRRRFPAEYGRVCPETFVLPFDKAKMVQTMDAEPDSLWIEKPYAASRGRGITVWAAADKDRLLEKVNQPREQLPPDLRNTEIKLKQPADPAAVVVQRYLKRPYLIDGLKFDLRIYVVVTSLDPLCCYIFPEGLGRFCTTPYSADPSTVSDSFAHLTNYSVQKYSLDYEKNEDADDMSRGSKRAYSAVLQRLQSDGVDIVQLRGRINDVIIKTLLSVAAHSRGAAQRAGMHRRQGFELYGIDIILDDQAQPMVLELNYSPDISAASPMDKLIKGRLLADTLNLVGVPLPPKAVAAAPMELGLTNREFSPKPPARALVHDTPDEVGNAGSPGVPLDVDANDVDLAEFLVELEEQSYRQGLLERMFPISSEQVLHYAQFVVEPAGGGFFGQDYLREHGCGGRGEADSGQPNIAGPAYVSEVQYRLKRLAELMQNTASGDQSVVSQ